MSKKLILFLMVLLFGSTSFLRADEVTIGDPTSTTTNSYLPTYSLYNYSFTQQIYTADEIGMGGTINDVTLWLKNTSSYARNLNVYMKEVSEVTFADGNAWVSMTAGDMVASGTLANGISDPVATTFTLTTPFEYSGEGNLVICFQDVTGSWSSGAASVVMTGNGNQAIYAYRDASLYDPTTPGVTGYVTANKSVVRLTIEGSGPVPPTPTGEIVITPNPFELGVRPTNGWMEPYAVRIENGGAPVSITANISNTAGVEAFSMSEEINDVVLDTDETLAFTIDINTNAADGEYVEQFTMFSVENSRDITTIPVTATFYTAGEADIVETAKTLAFSYTAGVAEFNHTPVDIHPNYFGSQGMIANDAVYQFTLAKDALFSVNAGTGNFIGIYNKVLNFHPTMAVEPVAYAIGEMQDEILLAGQYYMIVSGDNFTSIEGTVEQMPAPTAMTAIYPADGATEIAAPVTLTWEGGENASEYQVLFGTSPVNMPVVLDWTIVDNNFGSYTINNLQSNTQYFWQVKARNSNGNVQTLRCGFTSTLTAPNTVTASEEEIFTDGSTLIKWKHSSGTTGDLPETQIGSGTSTNSYLPTYNLYNYSLSEQIYTGEEIGEAGYINSISFHPVGAITRNLKIYMANTDKETFTSGSDWVAMEADNLVFEGNVDMVANTWVTVQLNEPFEFDGSNLLLAVTDHTGTWTSSIQYSVFDATAQAINVYQDSAPYSATAPAGSGTVRNFKNQIILNKESKGTEANRTFIGYNVYYGDVKANDELLTEKQFLLENLPYNMEGHDINVTAVYDEGESGHSTPIVTVKVSGYGTFTGTVTSLVTEVGGGQPVAGATVTFNGRDEFNNVVSFEGTTDDNGVYTINNVKAGDYVGTVTLEGMEPVSSEAVTLAYQGTETVDFIIHEEYKPVLSVYAEEIDETMSKVTWSLNTAISGGGTSGSASTFTEGFEGGMPADWSVIDGNNDGYTWCLTSAIPTTWTYYASMTLDWYRTGTNAICSGSYINGVGALTPNEYLVMGQQMIANGSTLSFWAAATDASYPADHFGVAVSDDAANWTMVQEWTLTGKKGANGGRESREGEGAKLGTWYNYTVDLSAYAGQKYIALRHFNCNDQYIMCVDDIELSAGKGRSVKNYAIYRKAILKENEIVPADSVVLSETVTDTLYADFTWNNMEPGLYQYGVQAIYPTPVDAKGNRNEELTVHDGTGTNSYVPCYGFYADAYLKCEMVYPAEELAAMAGASISSITFYASTPATDPWTGTWQVFVNEVADATISTFAGPGTVVYEGTLDATAETMTINFDTPYTYNGGNLLVGVYLTETGNYKSVSWAGEAVTGASVQGYNYSSLASVSPSQRNFLPKTTFSYAGGGGGNDDPVTPITWSNILPKDMETVVTVNAQVAAGTPAGATVIMTNTFEDIVFTGEFDETGVVVFDEFHKGNYVVTVDLPGYTSSMIDEEVSIWDETELTAILTEIYKPVEEITVSVTGYAMWTPIVPVDRIAEKYFVTLNGIYYGETTDNFMQIDEDVLIENEQYTVGVAVVYSTGMSAYVTKNFTYLGCAGVATQVEDLHVDEEASTGMDVVLVWNGGTPTPPTPPTPPTGDVVVKLTAHNVWGDGTGYQMLLDDTHSLYGSTIPTSGALSTACSGNEGIYSQFSHKIPTNADGNCTTSNMVLDGTVEITIPAGTYDWCITNPTPGDRIWIAAANGNVGGRYDDYVFEGGHTYEFTVSMYGSNDGVDVTITGGKSMNQPNMGIMSNDVRTNNFVANNNVMKAGEGFGAAENQMTRDWYYYDNGVNEDAIGTGGGNFWWGIMLPAGSYDGTSLTKVAAYDYMSMTGTASIYQGGATAPAGSALASVNVTFTESNDFVEFTFAEPVTLDPSQNVWVVFYNGSGATYPAAVCNNTGDANGRWVSLDGTTWEDLASYSLNYTFMVRAFIEAGGPSPVTPTGSITPNAFNIAVDDLENIVGATTSSTAVVTAEDYEEHTYYVFYVDAQYGMSCPAEVTYQILSVEENEVITSIYPNPTSGDLHINATAMTHISVVNAMGQVVYEQDVNADEMVINMAQFESGVYMVSIITENGTSVKRITVTK